MSNISGTTSENVSDHRNPTDDNIGGHSNNATTNALRRQRLDDSGNDSGHNSIMTSKYVK